MVRARVGLVLVGLPLLLGSGLRTRGAHPSVDCPETPGQIVMELVNAERAKQGLGALRVNPKLHQAAQAHARELAAGADAGHLGRDGSGPAERADRVGYEWTSIGENVAAGQSTAAEVVTVWMGSPPHRQSILDARFQEAAVGFEPDSASRWGTYWVMVFGARDGIEESPGQECNP
jgi:uncharacterized protein YkwD